jgi:predicted transcriptional regulator
MRATGEKHPRVKFTDAQVREVRNMASNGIKQSKIAELFCMTQGWVSQIVNGIGRKDSLNGRSS